jgi:hypothetical protein
MPRSEVVDRHPDPEGVQPGQDARRQVDVVHGQMLGDLQAELAGIDAGGPHDAGHLFEPFGDLTRNCDAIRTAMHRV